MTHAPEFVYPEEHQQIGNLLARLAHMVDHCCHHHFLPCRLPHPYILHRSSPVYQSVPFGLNGFVFLHGIGEAALVHLRFLCNSTCEPCIDQMSTPSMTMSCEMRSCYISLRVHCKIHIGTVPSQILQGMNSRSLLQVQGKLQPHSKGELAELPIVHA